MRLPTVEGQNQSVDALAVRFKAVSATGASSLWTTTVPYPLGRYDNSHFRNRVDCINLSIRKVVANTEGMLILDLAELQCPDGKCTLSYKGQEMRPDGVHYDLEGVRALAEVTVGLVLPEVLDKAAKNETNKPQKNEL